MMAAPCTPHPGPPSAPPPFPTQPPIEASFALSARCCSLPPNANSTTPTPPQHLQATRSPTCTMPPRRWRARTRWRAHPSFTYLTSRWRWCGTGSLTTRGPATASSQRAGTCALRSTHCWMARPCPRPSPASAATSSGTLGRSPSGLGRSRSSNRAFVCQPEPLC